MQRTLVLLLAGILVAGALFGLSGCAKKPPVEEPIDLGAKTEQELVRLASKSRAAFSATKRFLLGESWRRMSEPSQSDDELFLDCWFSEETQNRISGTVARLGS